MKKFQLKKIQVKVDCGKPEIILNSHARTLGTTINETVQTVGY